MIPLKCQISLQVRSVADFTCSRQCTVPLHKAAVWTVLLSPNCHLPGPVLRSGICPVVPRKVRWIIPSVPNTSHVSRLHVCCPLVFTQVISPSWFLPLSWRAACRCGWARSASTASETPSVPTQSWSSALKDWELRPSYWRQGEHSEYLLSLRVLWAVRSVSARKTQILDVFECQQSSHTRTKEADFGEPGWMID